MGSLLLGGGGGSGPTHEESLDGIESTLEFGELPAESPVILRQIVDLAFDAPKIAPQPKEANDQKERSTVLCQQQGHGRGRLLCTSLGHYMGSELYFNYRLYFHYMRVERIVSLTVSCKNSQANRVTAPRIHR